MNTVKERIAALRRSMSARGLTHYLVPHADEHLDEYLPPSRLRRQWLSGFTGSAGELLVGMDDAETLLFTDGRYHLQAARELEGSGIELRKVGAPGVKTLAQTLKDLARLHSDRFVLGFDPRVLPVATAEAYATAVSSGNARCQPVAENLVDGLWSDRPRSPESALIECPKEWTGASFGEKVGAIRKRLADTGADALVAVRLDQIAWLTNLRSTDDVPYNPVFEAWLWLDAESVHLFVRAPERRLPPRFGADVPGFVAHAYDDFFPFLATVKARKVSLDPDRVTFSVLRALEENGLVIVTRQLSPLEAAKAQKNPTELDRMRHANLMASVAKTKSILWLTREVAAGRTVTEKRFLGEIERRYAEIPGYRGLSFNTIAATGPHGAVIHYGGADDTRLEPGHLFIIDSGIQMDGGTTDDTRTVVIGKPTAEQRTKFTLVLKAHIRGARQAFPESCPGAMIDAVTRAPMWSEFLNYDHGTGHGVGAFLNVHEGPFAIAETSRRATASLGLKTGMVTSIEPGYYEPGFGGVRLENLYAVKDARPTGANGDAGSNGAAKWLAFEPLTWIPFDPSLTDDAMLEAPERAWLRWYHGESIARLAPHLTREENEELRRSIG